MYYLLMTENTGGLANACVRFFTDREKASEMAQKGLKARSEIMSDGANVIRGDNFVAVENDGEDGLDSIRWEIGEVVSEA